MAERTNKTYAIEYVYPGTVGGEPVGVVYVKDMDDTIPGYSLEIGSKVYSYSKDPQTATQFASREEAEALAQDKRWPEVRIVEVVDNPQPGAA